MPKNRSVIRWLVIALLVALPALVYIAMSILRAAQRESAVQQARNQRASWARAVHELGASRNALAVGRPFPRLRLIPPNTLDSAFSHARPVIVMFSGRTPEPATHTEIKRLLDASPNSTLVMISSDGPSSVLRSQASLRHPRIYCARMVFEDYDSLKIITPGAYYTVDASRVVRGWTLFDDQNRFRPLRELLQGATPNPSVGGEGKARAS